MIWKCLALNFVCTLNLFLLAFVQAASGAVQCQLMDMVHPGVVPMHKVISFQAPRSFILACLGFFHLFLFYSVVLGGSVDCKCFLCGFAGEF